MLHSAKQLLQLIGESIRSPSRDKSLDTGHKHKRQDTHTPHTTQTVKDLPSSTLAPAAPLALTGPRTGLVNRRPLSYTNMFHSPQEAS